MTRSGKRQFSIASILVLTCIVAILIAIPRMTAGAKLHPTTILWFVTLHQMAVASTIAAIIWVMLGRSLSVAVFFTLLILGLWGPNLAATIEYSTTGRNARSLAVADTLGITQFLNSFYSSTSDLIGYNYVSTGR